MQKTLLIHGWNQKPHFFNPNYPTPSNSHWFPWISKQLIIRGEHAVAIEMPNSYYPNYEIWKTELERFELDESTTLVGHSCGGGFLIRYLSENNIKVKKVILVAPWIGTHTPASVQAIEARGEKISDVFDASFFDFAMDPDLANRTVEGITLFESTNDAEDVNASVAIIKSKLNNLKVITLSNRGHFTINGMNTTEFPELLHEITTADPLQF